MSDLPERLENNINIALRIDNRLSSRNMLRQNHPDFTSYPSRRLYPVPTARHFTAKNIYPIPNSSQEVTNEGSYGHVPMEIDAVTFRYRPPLTAEEKQRHREHDSASTVDNLNILSLTAN
ncbi:hypothetical protein AYI69_g3251 [Smittium culicis]|uniref:Uncharacterized protein n=1 Tax=Smittium culicis TaxID=133412 RepID=A0A1R1YKR6_9FUNG|nr:hypothetical protein AYI69_g3251 [Smittium culicis]